MSQMSRRNALALVGGGTILAAMPGASLRAASPTPEPAVAPWFTAGTVERDPIRRALSYAILAPNPHNRQPWQVELSGTDALTLRCDLDRRLAETDPFDRQITIGLGAFLELLSMAAAEQGLRADIDAFPDGEPVPRLDERPVARVTFSPDDAIRPDPLFRHILARRSNKAPYDMDRPVPALALDALRAALRHDTAIEGATDPAEVGALRDLTIAGMRVEMGLRETAMESVDLLRFGQDAVNARPDGIDLTGPEIETLIAQNVLNREAILAEMEAGGGPIMDQMLAYTIAPMEHTPAYLWQMTRGSGRRDQIAAGRDYVRLNLQATAMGLAIHPQSQTLREFDAMNTLYAEARALTDAGPARTVQMLCRLGYGPEVPPSPRWPVETVVTES